MSRLSGPSLLLLSFCVLGLGLREDLGLRLGEDLGLRLGEDLLEEGPDRSESSSQTLSPMSTGQEEVEESQRSGNSFTHPGVLERWAWEAMVAVLLSMPGTLGEELCSLCLSNSQH